MADHLDVPGEILGKLGIPGGDPRVDITDVYAFPGDAGKSILIMNVNPLTIGTEFNPAALYELKIDTDGDAHPDVAFRFKFSAVVGGSQTATVRRETGGPARGADNTGEVIFSGAPVSLTGAVRTGTTSAPYRFFAGKVGDPFFFDLLGFLDNFNFTGADFFADKNVFGIVLEVPNSALGASSAVGIWGRTLLPVAGDMQQIDRMGRPAINTVFNKGKDKLKFNLGKPHTDRQRFGDNVVHVLMSFGYDATTANAIMNILLPDMLKYDPASTAPFESFTAGRKLTDDVIDKELGIVTKGALTGDGAGPHTYDSAFPFMETPH